MLPRINFETETVRLAEIAEQILQTLDPARRHTLLEEGFAVFTKTVKAAGNVFMAPLDAEDIIELCGEYLQLCLALCEKPTPPPRLSDVIQNLKSGSRAVFRGRSKKACLEDGRMTAELLSFGGALSSALLRIHILNEKFSIKYQ